MRTLESLKKLGKKLTGKTSVTGNTVDEVIDFIEANFAPTALALKDSDGAVYDITVTTKGVLQASPRSKVANPTFTPASGETFADTLNVEIACATNGATIYYTTNGDDPTKESSVYSEAITLSATTTIKAFADKANMTDSDVVTAIYIKTEAQA